MSVDAQTGVVQARVSVDHDCTNRSVLLRHPRTERVEASHDEGKTWFLLFDSAGSAAGTTDVGTLFAVAYVAKGSAEAMGPIEVGTPAGAFPDAERFDLSGFSGAFVNGSADWQPAVGLLNEGGGSARQGNSSSETFSLQGYDIAAPAGRIHAGTLPSDSTAAPHAPTSDSGRVYRTSPTSAHIGWGDCSVNEDTFDVERRCGSEADFSVIASLPFDTTEFVDTVTADQVCTYRVRAQNHNGDAVSDEIGLGLYGVTAAPYAQQDSKALYVNYTPPPGVDPATITGYALSWTNETIGGEVSLPPVPATWASFGASLFLGSDGQVTEVPDGGIGAPTNAIAWPAGTYRFKVAAVLGTVRLPFSAETALVVQ